MMKTSKKLKRISLILIPIFYILAIILVRQKINERNEKEEKRKFLVTSTKDEFVRADNEYHDEILKITKEGFLKTHRILKALDRTVEIAKKKMISVKQGSNLKAVKSVKASIEDVLKKLDKAERACVKVNTEKYLRLYEFFRSKNPNLEAKLIKELNDEEKKEEDYTRRDFGTLREIWLESKDYYRFLIEEVYVSSVPEEEVKKKVEQYKQKIKSLCEEREKQKKEDEEKLKNFLPNSKLSDFK